MLDNFRSRIVGRSIDSSPNAKLVINAVDMALKNGDPHIERWSMSITQRNSPLGHLAIRSAGLMPSFGTDGDELDNAIDGIVLVVNANRPSGPEEGEYQG